MARKSRSDWLDEGVRVLAADGRGALTIERMTAALGVTKGSFYHHFASAGDFERQVVGHWAAQFLEPIEALPGNAGVPVSFLGRLAREAYGPTTAAEMAVRAWGHEDAAIWPYVARVDAARRAFVRRVLAQAIANPVELDVATDTLTAMLVGGLALEPPFTPERVAQLYAEFETRYAIGASPSEALRKAGE